MKNRRILIIDDDSSVRECLCDALTLENYVVTMAENGLEALHQLEVSDESDLPECIICDLMMPVMGGLQFLETLSSDCRPSLCNIPVIVATAQPWVHGKRALPKAKDLLSKPVDILDLYRAVEKNLLH